MAFDGSLKFDTAVDSKGFHSGIEKIGSLAADGCKAVAGAFAAAYAAAGAAVAGLTKTAVENYADYEQLVGGVETLFKDSADTVMDYANAAFETAGLSANATWKRSHHSLRPCSSPWAATRWKRRTKQHGNRGHVRQRQQNGHGHGVHSERLPGVRKTELHHAGQPEAGLRRHQKGNGAAAGGCAEDLRREVQRGIVLGHRGRHPCDPDGNGHHRHHCKRGVHHHSGFGECRQIRLDKLGDRSCRQQSGFRAADGKI